MKIGTLTFFNEQNYGAVLQAYALQQILRNLHCQSELIDYWLTPSNSLLNGQNFLNYGGSKIHYSIRETILYLCGYPKTDLDLRAKRTQAFIRENMPVSSVAYRTPAELKSATNYDTYVCGSDQIWNPNVHFSRPFLLRFVPSHKCKIAYAASFGTNSIPAGKINEYKEALLRFSAISVREKQGAELVRSLTGREAEVVLDPSLLLTKCDYLKLLPSESLYSEEYILCYVLGDLERFLPFIKKVSTHYGKRVILLTSPYLVHKLRAASVKHPSSFKRVITILNELKQSDEITCRFDAGPVEFIRLVAGASSILTDSFHGMAFSITFQKPFSVFSNTTHLSGSVSSRIRHLANILELNECVYDDWPSAGYLNRAVDYVRVASILRHESEKSIDFLKKNLIF